MENQNSQSFRQHLARCYSLASTTQDRRSWQQRSRDAWRNFAAFMIHKPQLQLNQEVSQSDYARKLRLYPYLPLIEENRDWLEKSYRNFKKY